MNATARGELPLTKLEKGALVGYMLRERDLVKEQQVLQADIREAFGLIEERLGLEAGAINRTHRLNLDAGVLAMLAPQPLASPQPESAPAAYEVVAERSAASSPNDAPPD